MNRIPRCITGLLFSILALSAFPAGAAIDKVFVWKDLARNNTEGTSSKNLSPHETSLCFLTKVGFTDIDTGAEKAHCAIEADGSVWQLRAYLGASSDADVICSARCYSLD